METALTAQLLGVTRSEGTEGPVYTVTFVIDGAQHVIQIGVDGDQHRAQPSLQLVPAMQAFMRPPTDDPEQQRLRQIGQLVDSMMSRLVNSGLLIGWQARLSTELVPSLAPAEATLQPDGSVLFDGQRQTHVSAITAPDLMMALTRDRLGAADSDGVEQFLQLKGLPFTSTEPEKPTP